MALHSYLKAAGLGLIAGMRSLSAPALVSRHFAHTPPAALLSSPLRWLAAPTTARALQALALGEVGADKLPGVPARIAPGPLLARAASGGLSGAALCVAEEQPAAVGAMLGALAAVASSYGFYHLRKSLAEEWRVPDPVLAVAEDALVLGIGRSVLGNADTA